MRRRVRTEVWERAVTSVADTALDPLQDPIESSFHRSENDAIAWYGLGYVLHAEGDLGGAEDAYRRAVSLDDSDPQAWFNLGNVLSDDARPAEAVEAYRESVALDANDHEAWNNLGAALCDVGKLREAVGCFETALAIDPGYHPSWNNLGNAVEAFDGNLRRAIEAYRRAIALRDDRANYHLNLASALCRLERADEGARHLDDALRMDPSLRTVVPAFPEFDGISPRLDGEPIRGGD
jgi:tetratricopeptide (TPR) repeat protein